MTKSSYYKRTAFSGLFCFNILGVSFYGFQTFDNQCFKSLGWKSR